VLPERKPGRRNPCRASQALFPPQAPRLAARRHPDLGYSSPTPREHRALALEATARASHPRSGQPKTSSTDPHRVK
jgi:hypothetical protein